MDHLSENNHQEEQQIHQKNMITIDREPIFDEEMIEQPSRLLENGQDDSGRNTPNPIPKSPNSNHNSGNELNDPIQERKDGSISKSDRIEKNEDQKMETESQPEKPDPISDEDPLKKLKSLKFKPMVRRPQISKKPEPIQRPPQVSLDEPIRRSERENRPIEPRREPENVSSGSELEEVHPRSPPPKEERSRKRKYEDEETNGEERRRERKEQPYRRPVNPQTFKKRIDLLSREESKMGLVDEGELRRLIGTCYELEYEQDYTFTTRIKLRDELIAIRSEEDHRIRRIIEAKPGHTQKAATDQYEELLRKQRGMANLHAMLANPMAAMMMPGGVGNPGPNMPFIPPMFTAPPPSTQIPPPMVVTGNGPTSTSEPPPSTVANPNGAAPLDFTKPPPSFHVPPPPIIPPAETKPTPVPVSTDFTQPPPSIPNPAPSIPQPSVSVSMPSELPNLSQPPPSFTQPPPSSNPATNLTEKNPWKMENASNSTPATAPYNNQDREFGSISVPSSGPSLPPNPSQLQTGQQQQPNSGANIATMLTNLIASSIRMGNAGGPMMGTSPSRTGLGGSPQKTFGSPQRPQRRSGGGRPMKKTQDRERTDSNSSGPAVAEA